MYLKSKLITSQLSFCVWCTTLIKYRILKFLSYGNLNGKKRVKEIDNPFWKSVATAFSEIQEKKTIMVIVFIHNRFSIMTILILRICNYERTVS